MLDIKAPMAKEEIEEAITEAAFSGMTEAKKASMQKFAKQLHKQNPGMSVRKIMARTAKQYGVKIVWILLLVFTLAACKKEQPECNRWSVDQYCDPKPNLPMPVVCTYVTTEYISCEKHNPGDIEMYREDAYVKYYRKYNFIK